MIFHLLFRVTFSALVLSCTTVHAVAASIADSQEAETFKAPPNLARIYLEANDALYNTVISLKSESKTLGAIAYQQYMYIDVLPGTYSFNLEYPAPRHWKDQASQRFTEFDLSLTANSVALIHCEWGKSGRLGFSSRVMTKDPVLREFEISCPSGPNSDSAGIKSCLVAHTKKLKPRDYGSRFSDVPGGTCQLIDDTTVFAGYDLVKPSIQTYLSTEESAYQFALKTGTSLAYQNFLADYPDTTERAKIETLINRLSVEETQITLEKNISKAIRRDAALPLNARRDKYMIALTGHLKNQNFKSSLLYFELLDRLKVELSPSITHFWGEALLRTGQPERALKKLYEYIEVAGPSGTYYRDALALITEAENQ